MTYLAWGLPPQAYLFGDWTVPWMVVFAIMGLFYLWAWWGKNK